MKADVSALMDGALEDPSQSSVLNSLGRDPQLRRAWSEYHLIGDVLRRSPRLSSDVTARVMARLADEPTVLAPRAAARRSPVLRYALPLAASVMGVGAVAWVAQTLNAPEAVQVAALKPAAPSASGTGTPAVAVPQPEAAAVPVVEEVDATKASQVKPYLFAHQSYSPVGIHGVANYVRIVSDTREGPAR
jgi:sigma-E factor negative regulatory protein RseA